MDKERGKEKGERKGALCSLWGGNLLRDGMGVFVPEYQELFSRVFIACFLLSNLSHFFFFFFFENFMRVGSNRCTLSGGRNWKEKNKQNQPGQRINDDIINKR